MISKESIFAAILDSPWLATTLSLVGKVVVAVASGVFVNTMSTNDVPWTAFYEKVSFWALVVIIIVGGWVRHELSEATYEIIDAESAKRHLVSRVVPKLGDYVEREIEKGNLNSIDEAVQKLDIFDESQNS